ncbi:transcription factor IIIA [[Candida] anglica]|uniref:Transcription factor IIIA n=1 Tax=[Candida] anglica TaxID=148631 RepID=A0ABP0EGM2_9ASCO
MGTGSVSSVSSRTTTASSAPKVHICDVCGKSYAKPSLLAQHQRTHSNERPFKCPHEGCEKSFFRKSHLQAHELSHQSEESKPFTCSVCGKGVNSKQHLKRHEITHTKSFSCTVEGCNESFYKHQSLRHHILSVHERSLSCKICNKTFSRPNRLAQHNLKFHSETPVYQCDHHGCFGNFKTWSALQLHIKTEHPKLKCPICDKGCVGRKGLKSHMQIHDEEKMVKLWNCTYCDVGQFVKKSDLIEHYNTFHDGNVPEELLKPAAKEHLATLLSESTDPNTNPVTLAELNGFVVVASDEEDEDEDNADQMSNDMKGSQKSIDSLNSTLQSGKSSIIDLISKNFDAKKISCPKKNCDRKFSRQYDLQRHLAWHEAHMQKIESFLQSLETEESQGTRKRQIVDISASAKRRKEDNDYDDDDDEFNNLIDEEMKKAQEGSLLA